MAAACFAPACFVMACGAEQEPVEETDSAVTTPSSSATATASNTVCPSAPEFVEPQALSQTGLYAHGADGPLAAGVYEFRPQYELWSDGATKRRYVYLPPCTQIDTSDMDFWTYPRGTKLWKEFTRNGADGQPVRVETRLLEKYTNTKWFMTSFVWNDDQSDARVSVEDGEDNYVLLQNAKGTEHDVPGRAACSDCHGGMKDKVLGFSALQLSTAAEPGFMNLQRLLDEALVTTAPSAPLVLPGTAEQVAALGYMHANCGHCHNPKAKDASLGLELWQLSAKLGAMTQTTAYSSAVNRETQSPESPVGEPELRIVPGDLAQSALYWRLTQPPIYPEMPEGGAHMPLIGSELTDPHGVDVIGAWIRSLN